MSEKKTSYGIWLLAIKFIAKFGGKAFTLLLKLLKFSKFSWAVSMGAYAAVFNWKFALMIIASLFVHEYGHVWAMKRAGMSVKGMYFIPFLGAAAVAESQFPSRKDETRIALMGPLWGLSLAALTYGAYALTHEPIIAAVAGWMAMVNLFNLLPVMPLDGGRVLRCVATSFSSWLGLILFLFITFAAIAFSIKLGMYLILFVFCLGFGETIVDAIKSMGNNRRERAAQDLAGLFGTDAKPKAVANAIHELLHQLRDWHCANCCNCEHDITRRDLDLYATLKNEPFRSAAQQGWSDYLAAPLRLLKPSDTPARQGEDDPALWHPLEALLEQRMRDAKWYARKRDKLYAQLQAKYGAASYPDILNELDADLRLGDDTTKPMNMPQLAVAAIGYLGIAAFLIFLLLATKHVPGADAAFNVFKD